MLPIARAFVCLSVYSRAALCCLLALLVFAAPSSASDDDTCNTPKCQKQRNKDINPPKKMRKAGDPVILFTGDFDLDETDLRIAGRGMNVSFDRSYRSGTVVNSALGQKWNFSWDQHIVLQFRDPPEPAYAGPVAHTATAGATIAPFRVAGAYYYNGDSRIDEFAYAPGSGTQLWYTPDGYFSKLRHEPANPLSDGAPQRFILRSADGTTFTFGARDLGLNPYVQGGVYRLTEIRDRRGNTITFEYERCTLLTYDFNRLARVRDSLNREITLEYHDTGTAQNKLLLESITDFDGRTVVFQHDSLGNLISVRSPVIVGTPTGNDFDQGRTVEYGYGTAPEKHLLTTIIDAIQSEKRPSIPYVHNTYDVDGRVVRQVFGGTDDSEVSAGGLHGFFYKSYPVPGVPVTLPSGVYFKTNETMHVDPSGLVTRVCYDYQGSERQTFLYTRRYEHMTTATSFDDVLGGLSLGVRAWNGAESPDPDYFETQQDYNKDGLVEEVRASGVRTRYTYYSGRDSFQRGNVIKTERFPSLGTTAPITTVTAYEPIYNQVRAVIDPRGCDPNYVPQNGGTWSADRYMTETIFDYQEGTYSGSAASAMAFLWAIDTNQATQFAVLSGTSLAPMPASCTLGDVNGDGTDLQEFGNAIVSKSPTAHLYSDVASPSATFDCMACEQEIVTKVRYNGFSQPKATIDAEGAVTSYEYYASAGTGAVSANHGGFLARTLYPEVVETRLEYDALGRVVKELGPRKNGPDWFTTEIVYNAADEIVQTIDALGHVEEAIYDAEGRVTSTRRLTRVPTFTDGIPVGLEDGPVIVDHFKYDLLNNLIEEDRQANGSTRLVTRHRYDRSGNRVLTLLPESLDPSNEDFASNVISTIYDERGLVWKSTRGGIDAQFRDVLANDDITLGAENADSSTAETTYNLAGSTVKVKDGEGNESASIYDPFERLIETRDPLGNRVEMTLDVAGQTIESKLKQYQNGGSGNVIGHTKTRFDELGRSFQTDAALFAIGTSVLTPDGPLSPGDGFVTTRVLFDKKGRVVQSVDDNRVSMRTTYDELDRVERVEEDPVGSVPANYVVTGYDKAGNVIRTESVEHDTAGTPQSFVTRSFYDPLDRLVAAVDNAGQAARFAYDSRGNKVFQSDAKSATVSTSLSSLDTYAEHGSLPSVSVNSHGNTTRFAYDDASRLLSTTRYMRTDGLGGNSVDSSQAGGSIVTSQAFDDNSRLISQTDDNSNATSYVYDALNRPVLTTFADGTTSSTVYDKRNLVKEWTDANGRHLVNAYDANGRLKTRAFAASPSTAIESYNYDGAGRMTSASDDDSSMARMYDSLGRVIVETLNGKTTSAVYDGVGNLKTCAYPSGREVVREYDVLNRLSTVHDEGGSTNLAEYRYIGPRRVERRDYPISGLRTAVSYDAVQRVDGIDHFVVLSSAHVDERSFTWDRASNKLSRTNLQSGLAHEYLYNSVYQMVDSERSGASTTTKVLDYGLDGAGNRTQVATNGGTPSVYSMAGTGDAAMNQYTSTPADGYTGTPLDSRTYDDEGNLTHITVTGAHDVALSYDYRNLMTEYDDSVTGQRHVYAYDALGRRTGKTVDADGSPQVTAYYYLGSRIIEERDGSDAVVATYVHGNGLDEVLSMRRGSDDYFYHADDLGSVMKVTDDTGSIVAQYEYSDFGELLTDNSSTLPPVTTSTIGDPISFTGARLDLETGWYFLRTRYLDPQRGRFTTRDSIGIWGDAGNFGNASAYTSNNPWTYVDPYGMKSCGSRPMSGYAKYKLGQAIKRLARLAGGMMGDLRSSKSQKPGGDALADAQREAGLSALLHGSASGLSPFEVNNIIEYATKNPMQCQTAELSRVPMQVCGGPTGYEAFFNLTPNKNAPVTPVREFDWGEFAIDVGVGVAAGVGMYFGVTELLGVLGVGSGLMISGGGTAAIAVPAVTTGELIAAGAGVATTIVVGASDPSEQWKKLSDGEAKRFGEREGIDIHELKPNSKYDLFTNKKGDVYVKPKDGSGPGDFTGYNIKGRQ